MSEPSGATKDPSGPQRRHVTTEDLRTALAAVAQSTLSPVTAALGTFYTVLIFAHAVFVPRPQAYWLILSASVTAASLVALHTTVRRRRLAPKWAHAFEALVVALLLWNSLFHLYLVKEPRQTTNAILVVAGCGFLLVSEAWLAVAIVAALAGWAGAMYSIGAPPDAWRHYGVAMVEAAILGVVVHVVTFRRLHQVQLLEAAQKQKLEQTSEELKKLALVDALTGLNNRRSLMTLGEHRLRLAQRTGQTLTLLFIDLDGMKRVNDTWGHQEGDRALIDAALIMASTFRDSDIVARIGGDEFCALVEGDGDESVPEKRLQTTLDASNAQRHRPYRLSWSVGSAAFDPANPCSMEELIERADRSMYEQKRKRPA